MIFHTINDYVELTLSQDTIQVHLDICSINIKREDEGVVIDIWKKDFVGDGPVNSTWILTDELIEEESA